MARSGKYRVFLERTEKAKAKCAEHYLGIIKEAAEGSKTAKWQPAAWVLERRFKYVKPPNTYLQVVKPEDGPPSPVGPRKGSKAWREAVLGELSSLPAEMLKEALAKSSNEPG